MRRGSEEMNQGHTICVDPERRDGSTTLGGEVGRRKDHDPGESEYDNRDSIRL